MLQINYKYLTAAYGDVNRAMTMTLWTSLELAINGLLKDSLLSRQKALLQVLVGNNPLDKALLYCRP